MPDLPKKKVGIVSCSGEEIPEGTVTRLAALKVLEQLHPADTVTICLPLFLAGGEGDRAFARFYPTIAIDGCDKRCAARGTEMYSGKPAASIVVTELVAKLGLDRPEGKRRLVDELLKKHWNRTTGAIEEIAAPKVHEQVQATCSCGSGIPVQDIIVNGQPVTLTALPLIFQQFHDSGKPASQAVSRELLDTVKIYNLIPPSEDEAYAASLVREYAAFCEQQGVER